jgi:hypothetical protein
LRGLEVRIDFALDADELAGPFQVREARTQIPISHVYFLSPIFTK